MHTKNLPEFRIKLYPLSDKAKKARCFKWSEPIIGRRGTIGGRADFIQGEYWPECLSCKKDMVFYAQLDSVGDDYMMADCALIYVFICPHCHETETFVQSY